MELKSAADDLFVQLQKARMVAIKTNKKVTLSFTTAVTCPGGEYSFTDADGKTIASNTLPDETCLAASDYLVDEGFTPKGLPTAPAERTLTISHAKLTDSGERRYIITQSVSGNIKLDQDTMP